MHRYSIVIVAKDAAHKIGRLLESLQGLSDDVIVCDTGSTDDTPGIARAFGAQVHSIPWEGYGKSKNVAISYARYDWILSLDSDEKIDEVLYKELAAWQPANDHTIYQVKWKNFFGNQWIKHSGWGNDWKNRLFNKHVVSWDNAIAHEDVTATVPVQHVRLNGYLEHYTFRDEDEYKAKMTHSAMITALKYHMRGKSSTLLHVVFCPVYSFLKTFLLKAGFLDGSRGWLITRTTAYYTYLKYARLRKLNSERGQDALPPSANSSTPSGK